MGAHVTKGTIDDAIVASALGNMAHGESLSVDERNNAIRRMIVEYSRESKRAKAAGEPPLGGAQRWVASVMGVSQTTVQRVMKTDQIRLLDKETFSRKANDEGKVEGPSDSFIAEFHPALHQHPRGQGACQEGTQPRHRGRLEPGGRPRIRQTEGPRPQRRHEKGASVERSAPASRQKGRRWAHAYR